MARKPKLQPGEYGVQIVYISGAKKWKNVVFKSLDEAKEYIHELEAFEFADDWEGILLVDSNGDTVKWW